MILAHCALLIILFLLPAFSFRISISVNGLQFSGTFLNRLSTLVYENNVGPMAVVHTDMSIISFVIGPCSQNMGCIYSLTKEQAL